MRVWSGGFWTPDWYCGDMWVWGRERLPRAGVGQKPGYTVVGLMLGSARNLGFLVPTWSLGLLESAGTLGPWELPGALGTSWCQNEQGA